MNENEKKQNRDLRRSNDANAAIRGCMYSEINKSCIQALLNDSELSAAKMKKLLLIAKESNENSKKLLVSSQNTIGRRVCMTYASKQMHQLLLAFKNKENPDAVKSISKFIVDNNMIKLANMITDIDQSGTYCNHITVLHSSF